MEFFLPQQCNEFLLPGNCLECGLYVAIEDQAGETRNGVSGLSEPSPQGQLSPCKFDLPQCSGAVVLLLKHSVQ